MSADAQIPDAASPVVDRLSPARRPARRAVMRQNWRDLLFLHWPFSPEEVRPFLPPQLELDLFDTTAYVGLVPFTMTGVRPVGFPPVRGLSSFHETNVRTYVRLGNRDPGVWFFSLDAANSCAVRLARKFFHLPYHRAQMFLEREPTDSRGEPPTLVYAGVRCWPGPLPASYAIRATPAGVPQPAQCDTLEHFLAERYILYTFWGDRLYQGRVHHSPYPLQPAQLLSLDETMLLATGFNRPTVTPLAHFAAGVDVEIFGLSVLR
jgi:uncharacterized protein YqjF (DUF2071 family)